MIFDFTVLNDSPSTNSFLLEISQSTSSSITSQDSIITKEMQLTPPKLIKGHSSSVSFRVPKLKLQHFSFYVFTDDLKTLCSLNTNHKDYKLPLSFKRNSLILKDRKRKREIFLDENGNIIDLPVWHKISRNIYLNRSRNEKANVPCTCSLDDKCADGVCVNRSCYIECDPKTCPCGEGCTNQRIQKKEYAPTRLFYTGARGWGLKADDDIKEGDLIVEYCGEVLDEDEFQKRLENIKGNKEVNFYFFQVTKSDIIDAGPKGNMARFINHSCDPNCITQTWTIGSHLRVGIFAKQDIEEGTELTYDYNFENYSPPDSMQRCLCGTDKCSGYLGERPKRSKK